MTTPAGHLVVIDDDAEMRALLQRYLGENGYAVRALADGTALERALARQPADVLILDVMLPGEDGLAICRRLRAAGEQTPIIMLTAKGDPVERVLGLEMGADDYLAKPFLPRELLARVAALQRRNLKAGYVRQGGRQLRFGQFVLDLDALSLTREGRQLDISTREFRLLAALAQQAGRPLSRAQLIDLAMGRDAGITERAIDVQVVRLRRLLEDDPARPRWIRTVWGHGYVFAKADEAP
ncbi:two-component system phosphate regulon response regulator OmpR [Pseudoduganella lurida]|uniref:Two-component system phosphate regulon response regulator OmpR n=1 Tax=Pseudoduganella lurida TaxID=1036180 RepID=A0A562R5F9_9BURK|nr:response regulator [Pseudoduganella lurida]TWI64298.1 two-component system phosphate regulon response regulator OmpR [Pseudoduganella lurida]